MGQDMKFDMKHQLLFTIQCGDQSYQKKFQICDAIFGFMQEDL
jgi:hypothetical protein